MAKKEYGAFTLSNYFPRSNPVVNHPNLYVELENWRGDNSAGGTLTAAVRVTSLIYDDVSKTVTVTVAPFNWTLSRSGNWGYNHKEFDNRISDHTGTKFIVLLSDGTTIMESSPLKANSSAAWSIGIATTTVLVISGVTSPPIKLGFTVDVKYGSAANYRWTTCFYARGAGIDWKDLQNVPPLHCQVNGVWKKANAIQTKLNGAWKEVDKIYVNNNGVWKESQ